VKLFGRELKFNGFDIWHKGNQGNGSGLDADSVDGKHASEFASNSHNHDAGSINSGTLADARIPGLNMSKITAGNLMTDRLSEPSFMTGSITRTARPLFDVLRADRTVFLPASQIIIERSTDRGITWEDHQVSDTNKARLFTGQRPNITIPLKNGVKSTDCMIRITITGMRFNVPIGTSETNRYSFWNSNYVQSTERYFSASEGWAWVSSLADRIYCKVERATGANPNSWILDREVFMSGWAGGNYFSLSGSVFGGGTTQTANPWNWRFTFRTATTSNDFDNGKLSLSYASSPQSIFHIKISGANVWSTSNNLMYNDHLYTWDENQNATFPANLRANGQDVVLNNDSRLSNARTPLSHTHTKSQISDMPIKLSQLENDIGAGSGLNIVASTTEPSINPGDWWYKEI